jgi:hypothetical protein
MLAAMLSKRLGWPDDKSNALKKEFDSYRAALSYPWNKANPVQGFGCEKVLRYDSFIDQLAAHGGSRRAAMRATIEAQRK